MITFQLFLLFLVAGDKSSLFFSFTKDKNVKNLIKNPTYNLTKIFKIETWLLRGPIPEHSK